MVVAKDEYVVMVMLPVVHYNTSLLAVHLTMHIYVRMFIIKYLYPFKDCLWLIIYFLNIHIHLRLFTSKNPLTYYRYPFKIVYS